MAKQESPIPIQKLFAGGGLGLAITTILVFIIEKAAKTTIPSTVVVAITTLLTGIISYLFPPAARDQVVP
jgi:hypothetical protein